MPRRHGHGSEAPALPATGLCFRPEVCVIMSADPVRPFDPSVRALIRGLADAGDAQLVRTVALLDSMPNRGAADALLDPVRKRLAGLHPRRPLNFCRLLF